MFTKGKVFISLITTVAMNATVVLAGTNGTTISYHADSSDIPVYHHIIHTSEALSQSLHAPLEKELTRQTATEQKPLGSHDNAIYATVKSGQTLWSIAREFGTSVTALERWNGLTDHSILHIGQRLVVGWGSSSSSASSRDGSVDQNVAAATEGLDIVHYAERFLGSPYAWGGDSPSGFDCSGFVMYAYRHFGISLPHTSFGQFERGVRVSRSNLAPGDLVFFSTAGSGASHVGIYAGNGRFINAAGSSIRFSSLSDGYWDSSYVGARRII